MNNNTYKFYMIDSQVRGYRNIRFSIALRTLKLEPKTYENFDTFDDLNKLRERSIYSMLEYEYIKTMLMPTRVALVNGVATPHGREEELLIVGIKKYENN